MLTECAYNKRKTNLDSQSSFTDTTITQYAQFASVIVKI